MRIEKLALKYFKGFRDFTVECSPFTVLVGLNNSGKTSILQAIQLLQGIVTFAFRGGESPDMTSPIWRHDPSKMIRQISYGDPDAIWLHKSTVEPCEIFAEFSDDVKVHIEIPGQSEYRLDILVSERSLAEGIKEKHEREVIEKLFGLRAMYIPPMGAVSPKEGFAAHPQHQQQLDEGKISQCWRAYLYWLYNDRGREHFEDVIENVAEYLPKVKLLPPRLTRGNPAEFEIQFEEEETVFDISTSGGGLRTLLNLVAVIRFSRSRCLLFDEPDAHLHAGLQREVARMLVEYATETAGQVFVATHAPEFLAELPAESFVWIDRTARHGEPSNELGRVLLNLGAVTKADAIRACGANKVLFIEGSVDRATLQRLITLAGGQNPFDDQSVLIGNLPSGKGDRVHLRTFRDLLRSVFKLDVAIVSLTDNDYELVRADGNADASNDAPLLLSLGCKEVENYLLSPEVFAKAATIAAERRNARTGKAISAPDSEAFRAKLNEILSDTKIRDTMRLQLVTGYMGSLDRKDDPSKRLGEAEKWFQEKWDDDQWRIRNCPGKAVLKRVREWCQDKHGLTLTTNALANALPECPEDIAKIAKKIQMFFYGNSSGA